MRDEEMMMISKDDKILLQPLTLSTKHPTLFGMVNSHSHSHSHSQFHSHSPLMCTATRSAA